MLPGKGVKAVADHMEILAGNASLLEENHISIPEKALSCAASYIQKGCTLIYLGIEKNFRRIYRTLGYLKRNGTGNDLPAEAAGADPCADDRGS